MSLVFQYLHVKPAVKLVALVLADHANEDGLCWPSYARIAERTGVDKRTVQRHVKTLTRMGVLTKVRTGCVSRERTQTIHLTNAYVLHADRLVELSTDELCTSDRTTYQCDDKTCTSMSAQLSTYTSENHQLNRQLLEHVESR